MSAVLRQLQKLAVSGEAGERLLYHTGLLARDRMDDRDLNKVAALAGRMEHDGLVRLAQRRIDRPGRETQFEYWATRTKQGSQAR